MANEFKVKKGLIVQGSGSTILDIQGSQGQLFSVTDSLSGSLFSVNDISGIPIMEVFSDDKVNLGTFGAEAIKVSGSTADITGSLFGTASYATTSTDVVNNSFTLGSTPIQLGNAYNTISGLSSVTSTNFVGALSGNATTATTATNATNLNVLNSTENASYPIVFSTTTTPGNKPLYTDDATTCHINPSKNEIGATTFRGALSGNATTATTANTATNVTATANNSTNETTYLTFVDGATGAQGIETDTALTYNPSTNILTAGTFAGALSGNATSATNIAITTQDTTPVTYNLTFTGATSGNSSLNVDTTTLTYNPSTGIFSTPIVNSTQGIKGGDGTASTPAFSFSGDTNNGMYRITTDTLGFSTAGIFRMSIDSTGNVGIGTPSPYSKFTTYGALSTATSQISIINDEGGHTILRTGIFGISNSGFSLITADVAGTNQNTRLVVGSTGNVGIGTTSPAHKLDVYTNIDNEYIASFSQDHATGWGVLIDTDGTSVADPALWVKNTASTIMWAAQNGYVGIGTSSPSTNLHIFGDSFSVNPSIKVTHDIALINQSIEVIGSAFDGGGIISVDTNANLIFKRGSSESMRINGQGNVGINATSPQGKFHVFQDTTLGGTAGNSLILQTLQNTGGAGGNVVFIKDYAVRDATGTNWLTWRHHNSIDIDGSHNTPGTNTKAFYERDPLSGLHEFGQEATYAVTIDGVNSRLGVATRTPSYPIHVNTDVSGTSIYASADIVAYSDESVKENIRPIENVIQRIEQSRGVLYDRTDIESKDNIGFIAQELEENFPELVTTNEDGTKAVKYQNTVAVLFEAIKEQQKQIEELKNMIINGIT